MSHRGFTDEEIAEGPAQGFEWILNRRMDFIDELITLGAKDEARLALEQLKLGLGRIDDAFLEREEIPVVELVKIVHDAEDEII